MKPLDQPSSRTQRIAGKRRSHSTDTIGAVGDTRFTTSTTNDEYGDLLSDEDGGGERYPMYDAQLCTNVMLDGAGNVQGQYKYLAFGQAHSAEASPGEGWASLTVDQWSGMSIDDWANLPIIAGGGLPGMGGGFAQKQYYLDPETELYMLGMGGGTGRHYDPATGRFISEDKIRQAGGDNVYNYVRSDPINRHDPSGQEGLAPDDPLAPVYAELAAQRQADAEAERKRIHAGGRWYDIVDETTYAAIGPLDTNSILFEDTEIRSAVVSVTKIQGTGEHGFWGSLLRTFRPAGPSSTHYEIELVGAPSNLNYADEAGRVWTETLKDFGQAIHETIEEHKSDTMAGFLGAVAAELLSAGLRLKGAVDEAKAATGGPGPATPFHPSELPSSNSAQQISPIEKRIEDLPNKGTERYRQVVNKLNRIGNQAAAGGNTGISGTINDAEAKFLGERWVGEGYTERTTSSGESLLISKDGLRQYRAPSQKSSSFATTGRQANFQMRSQPSGRWTANVHVNVD